MSRLAWVGAGLPLHTHPLLTLEALLALEPLLALVDLGSEAGDVISRRTRAPKSMDSKNGWLLGRVAPGRMEPRRNAGSATRSCSISSRVLRLRKGESRQGGNGLGTARNGLRLHGKRAWASSLAHLQGLTAA